jgi:hypothetical protein
MGAMLTDRVAALLVALPQVFVSTQSYVPASVPMTAAIM